MQQFLILFDNMPIDKESVKSGVNAPEIVTACRCVNVGLFLSGHLRRDTIVSIAKGYQDDMKIISFPGDTLRRVSPDERSISFFLLKASAMTDSLEIGSKSVLDNGIIISREGIKNIASQYSPESLFFAQQSCKSHLELSPNLKNALLIYDTGKLIDSTNLHSRGFHALPYQPHPERFILNVNEWLDNKENGT